MSPAAGASGRGKARGPTAPERGDLVWLEFSPQAGHEQSGRRPGLVLSPVAFNHRTGFAILCPVTSHVKGYPFEVVLPAGLPIGGAVLVHQVKSLDWRARNLQRAARAPDAVVADVLAKLRTLL